MKSSIECISCGSREFKTIAVNNEFSIPRDIIRCKRCNLAFINPLPKLEEIQRFYSQQYSLKHKSYHRRNFAIHLVSLFSGYFVNMRIKERFRYLASKDISLRGKNILEIGSADGKFLLELKRRDAKVGGVEPSKVESEISIKKFNIAPIAATTEELLPQHKGAYDIIFSYHVLEHLIDPLKELRNIKQLLKKGGYFIGEVPFTPQNVSMLENAIRRSVFDNLHIFHFSIKSIFNLLKKADLCDIEIERLELKSIFKKVYPEANIHYLHPSFERKFTVRFFSLLQALELGLRSLLGKPTMGPQRLANLESEWIGPNDWINFYARG